MRRRVFDVLTSAVGLVLVVVLLVAGGLLMWGYSYDHNNVHNQLAAQDIFFPTKAAFEHPKAGSEITAAMIPTVSQYAGQQLLTGPQAEAYADHFIAIHLSEMPYGGIYSKISTAARAEPTNTKLATLETTSFQGTTLRGLLLEAYGFSKIGTIMLIGSIASFILALVLLGFVGLGFRHAQRIPAEEELLRPKRSPALAGAPS
ncbi:MAG TPA: hypothetical protein VN892_12720 [Solirubrobacteraceae bacterium]|nr:hypothetical protein [Solirubrobacteraceae bacterium]